MTLTQTGAPPVSASTCENQPQADLKQLQHQLFEDLCAAGYAPRKIQTLFGLFSELARALEEQDVDYFSSALDTYVIAMDMSAHDVLDGFMKDQAPAAASSLHEQANQAFLPQGWTFIHDREQFCVLEARHLN